MAPAERQTRNSSGPWLWPLLLVIAGVVLLLDNFLLLGDFNALALLPLLLVVAGAQILIRGDLFASEETRSFGITRGSVESGTLEINSGEVDVEISALSREGRLIAGQYAANTRPYLNVEETYAHLKMDRSHTPWASLVDWRVGLARDLPWQVLVSTHLGRVNLDLQDVIAHDIVAATGLGEIRFTAPPESLGQIYLRSTLGNIHITTPAGYQTRILVDRGWFFGVHMDASRYENPEPNVYLSLDFDSDAPLVEIRVSGTFGDTFLI